MRARVRVLIGTVALALVAASCTGTDEGREGQFSVGLVDPGDLIPGDVQGPDGRAVVDVLWTGLVELDPETGRAVRKVAESITSSDQRVWTIRIKRGWRFHDESPVTARSFVGAWNATVAQGWRGSRLFTDVLRVQGAREVSGKRSARISGLEVVDERTFTMTLERPFSQLPVVLAMPAFLPLPDSVLRSRDWEAFRDRPIGDGPFEMAGPRRRGGPIEVVRFDGYPDSPGPVADTIVFKVYPDAKARYDDARDGNVDVVPDVPPERFADMPRDFGDRQLSRPGPHLTYLGFPTTDRRYRQMSVRHAFSLAIDRKAIAAQILDNQVAPATSLIPPAVRLGRRDASCRVCVYDPRAAKALLDGTGGFHGTVTIWYESGTGRGRWVNAVADQLRENLGIGSVTPRALDDRRYRDMLERGEPDGLFVLELDLGYPSPRDVLDPLFAKEGRANYAGYSDSGFDAMMARGDAASSVEESIRYYRLAENTVLRDAPTVPLWSERTYAVWSERVDGVTADALGGLRLDRVEVIG